MKFCLWLSGLPGSGKTTITKKLESFLKQCCIDTLTLHMDELRKVLTPEPTYRDDERDIVYGALAYIAALLVNREYNNVIIDATGNRKKYRDRARDLIPEFAEVYVKCPVEMCEKREASRDAEDRMSDLYLKASSGRLKGNFPGVTAVYEAPENPEIVVPSNELTPAESAEKIMEYIGSRWCDVNST